MFELLKNLPENYGRYFEPFIGDGALFFELQPYNAYISDMNKEPINLYQVVRDNVDELIKDLQKHNISKKLLMKRNFEKWLLTFRLCISDYCYYVDFNKVNKNVDNIKVERNNHTICPDQTTQKLHKT